MRAFLLTLVVAWLMGCGGQATESSVQVTDSAGVRVVQQGSWSALPTVAVAVAPAFEIGWGTDLQFETVPVGRLRGDGSAVVFDEGATSLYLISADGSTAERVGREGEGPGEFRTVDALVVLLGDTLVAYDRALGRLSRFGPDGTYLDSRQWVQGGPVSSRPVGVTTSGLLTWIPSSYSLQSGQEGMVTIAGPLVTSGPRGASPDTLTGVTLVTIDFQQGRPSRDPFMRFGMGGGYGGGFVWTFNDAPEIRWLDESGSLGQIARWEAVPTAVGDDAWTRYEEALTAMMMSRPRRPSPEQLATRLQGAREAAAATLPYFTFHALSREGEVWVSDYTMLAGPSASYTRFGHDGVAREVVSFPRPVRILDIRGRRVLGVVTDDFDVQAVVAYDLGS